MPQHEWTSSYAQWKKSDMKDNILHDSICMKKEENQ